MKSAANFLMDLMLARSTIASRISACEDSVRRCQAQLEVRLPQRDQQQQPGAAIPGAKSSMIVINGGKSRTYPRAFCGDLFDELFATHFITACKQNGREAACPCNTQSNLSAYLSYLVVHRRNTWRGELRNLMKAPDAPGSLWNF
jgi:hypothetical protein